MTMVMWVAAWLGASVVFASGWALGAAICQRRSWEMARDTGYRLGFEVGQQAPKGTPRPELWIEHHLPEDVEHDYSL